ncbi:hypothetical protein GWI33_013034 [Rhynchophorus ferrugineus]|uniref:Uncharacterized protein n=1 Tax=Rhynchophorus ferrugineus TaxID=354439 RepID=A0A834I473_RHYFE|nr:hypothetical protein GWI33_013034 [Rhynchophorus ferrugineus]
MRPNQPGYHIKVDRKTEPRRSRALLLARCTDACVRLCQHLTILGLRNDSASVNMFPCFHYVVVEFTTLHANSLSVGKDTNT